MSILVSLLVLSALIFFHELGHYAAARLMGVHIETFSIGFGSKIASFNKWGTQWKLSMIPLGGYVKMKGQDDSNPAHKSFDDDSYNVKTPTQKIFILLAGPIANFILAFVLYFIIALGGPNILSPVIGKVLKDSPAYIAGLESKDIVKSINNQDIKTWKDMSKIIEKSNGTLNISIQRNGFIETIMLTPKITQTTNMFNETI